MKSRTPSEDGNGKKQYQKPRLTTYGSLRRLTQQTKGGTKGDGGDARPTFATRA